MSMAQALADIALGFSTVLGGPYQDAVAKWPGTPVTDDGGSIVTPGTPVAKSCSVQVDSASEAMRLQDGFREKDMRLLVLAATLDGDMDTDATVEVLAGPHEGSWSIESVNRDPAGVYWECRGRAA
jgi:hypothetical protein